MDKKIIPYLGALINKLEDLLKKRTQRAFDAFTATFKKLMDTLFLEHGKMENHSNPQLFFQGIKGRRFSSDQFHNSLLNIIKKNEDRVFLELYPFIHEILSIYKVVVPELISDGLPILAETLVLLKRILHNEEVIKPLQELAELANNAATLMVTHDQVSDLGIIMQHGQNPAQNLALLAVRINQSISYAQREQYPYDQLDWRIIQVLGNIIYLANYQHLFIDLTSIQQDLITLAKYLNDLVQYEQSRFDTTIDEPKITQVNIPHLVEITQYFEDIENISRMIHYLEPLSHTNEDNLTNRLAVLRALCALGEASKTIVAFIKLDNRFFRKLENIRNGIIHPDGREARKNLKSFLLDKNDKTLFNLIIEFSDMFLFLKKLLKWRKLYFHLDEPNLVVPKSLFESPMLSAVELKLRKFKLTEERRQILKAVLPNADKRFINQQRQTLSDILYGRLQLPARFEEFSKLTDGLGLSKAKVKDLYVKLKQKEIVTGIKEGIIKGNYENVGKRIGSLQPSKQKKEELTEILNEIGGNYQLLLPFLMEYEKDVTPGYAEIEILLSKLPPDEINLKSVKIRLLNAINQEEDMAEETTLLKDIDIVFFGDPENAKLWRQAINDIIRGDPHNQPQQSAENQPPKPAQSPQSVYDYIIKQLDEIIRSIRLINQILAENKFEFTPDYKYSQFTDNIPLVFACEHAFTLFYIYAKSLLNKIEEIKDYNDISTYSIFIPDFVDDLQQELTNYLSHRHNISHLHGVYLRPHESPFIDTFRLINFLEHITKGIYFHEAIVINPSGVDRQPMRATSLLKKLEQCKQLAVKTKNEQINRLINQIEENRILYNEITKTQKNILQKLNIQLTDYQILIQYKEVDQQDKHHKDKSDLYDVTKELVTLNQQFQQLQNQLLYFLDPIKATKSSKPLEASDKPNYVLQINPNVCFKETVIPGDGWCAMYAAGFGQHGQLQPEQVITNLIQHVHVPDIAEQLTRSLDNNFQASLSLNGVFDLQSNDTDGNSILDKIKTLYQAVRQADGASHAAAKASYINYISRPDVLIAYLNYLISTKYADAIIVQTCLSLIGKKLALFINYSLPNGQLVNCTADGVDITHPNTVKIVFYPSANPLTAHYNNLDLMVNHTFTHRTANAHSVHLAGSFNQWLNAKDGHIKLEGAANYAMVEREPGLWEITILLSIDSHEFKFVIDSGQGKKENWKNAEDQHQYPLTNTEYQNSSINMRTFLNSLNIQFDSNLIFIKHQLPSHMLPIDVTQNTSFPFSAITHTLKSDKEEKEEKIKTTTYAKLLSNTLVKNEDEDKTSVELAKAIAESEKEYAIVDEQHRIQENYYKQQQKKDASKTTTVSDDFEHDMVPEEKNQEELVDNENEEYPDGSDDESPTQTSSPSLLHE